MPHRLALLSLLGLLACEGRDGRELLGVGVDLGSCAISADTGAIDNATVSAWAVLDVIVMVVDDIVLDCDPAPQAQASPQDGVVRVDILSGGGSSCTCAREVTVTIVDVQAGDWLVDVYLDGDYQGTAPVSVQAIAR